MKRTLVFSAISVGCVVILMAVFSETSTQNRSNVEKNVTVHGVPVSFVYAAPRNYPATIKAFGRVTPLWQTTLRAQVDGAITYVAPNLQPGSRVKQGDLLVKIDPRPYLFELAEAKSRLAHTNVAYLTQRHEAEEARNNWKRSGLQGKPSSELVFRRPQLEASLSDVQSAKAAIVYALKKLEDTNVTAPFDGIVVSRTVDIQESLFVGDEIALLIADESAEIPVKLDLDQWDQLRAPKDSANVTLKEPRLGTTWIAGIKRRGQSVEEQTGLRTLYLQIRSPLSQTPPLLPGTFVEASIEGKSYPGLLRIPQTALTKRGRIWRIDATDHLRPHEVKVLFYGDGVVYVVSPQPSGKLRIAVKPNNGFVNGKRVVPVEVK